jgi:flagellin
MEANNYFQGGIFMRINNNLMAMNTHRQLGINAQNGAKSIEKLSSGYRINRAGDDAAGLAISEKMRGQIRGLNQASRNSQDAISMIQTAEGALNETQAILQRMRELAVQSANDTNVDADRTAIQDEIDQLATEITRIGDTTEFNTQKLLDGSLDEVQFQIGANQSQDMNLSVGDMRADALEIVDDAVDIGDHGSAVNSVDVDLGFEVSGVTLSAAEGSAVAATKDATGIDDTQYIETYDNAYAQGISGTLTVESNNIAVEDADILWSELMGSGSSITIDKASGGSTTVSVTITAVTSGATGHYEFSGAAEFATYNSGTGYYEYSGHGVSFSISKADFDAASGESLQLNFDAFVASGGAAYNASGDHGTLSTYRLSGGNGVDVIDLGDITFTSGYPSGIKSIKISGTGLDGTSGIITVTMYDSGGNALVTDEYMFSGAAANGLDTWTYDNYGVTFTLSDMSGAISGGISGFAFDSTAGAGSGVNLSVVDYSIDLSGASGDTTFTITDQNGSDTSFTVNLASGVHNIDDIADAINNAAELAGFSGDVATASGGELSLTALTTGDDSVISVSGTLSGVFGAVDAEGSDTSVVLTLADGSGTTIDTATIAPSVSSVTFEDASGNEATFNLDTFDTLSGLDVSSAYSASNLTRETAGIDVSSTTAASQAITTINEAIESVSTERSKLGAVQNRLEHTIKNLDTSAENLQASESRIRDVDMAKEMMEFTKNNILQQAAQSMLAQANQAPQGVLQLLR